MTTRTFGRGILEYLAEFVANGDAKPTDVHAAACCAAFDYFGVAAHGTTHPDVPPLLRHVRATYAVGNSTVLGLPTKMAAEAAAYVNGATGHMDDYDDHHDTVGGHPTVVVMPAALAVGEARGATAEEILDAYVVGVEVMCALGRCLNHTHYERGWHPTATLGVFGAGAAAARLSGLDCEGVVRTMSICASSASGLKGNFGTATKPIQVGAASAKGVAAAQLAQLGVSASPTIMDGSGSFANAYNHGVEANWQRLEGLGAKWELLRPGLIFKLYPCCGSTHAPIEAALQLRRDAGALMPAPDDIATVAIRMHHRRLPHTNNPSPHTPAEARFSVQYVTAAALLRGEISPVDFTRQMITDPAVRKLLAKVEVAALEPDEWAIPPGRTDSFAAHVTINCTAGRQLSAKTSGPRGFDPKYPLQLDDLRPKFASNVGLAQHDRLNGEIERWLAGASEDSPLARLNELICKTVNLDGAKG